MPKRPGVNQDRLVEASLELIQEQGEQGLTFVALAKKLGIKPPSLYNHVRSIDDLKYILRLRGLRLLESDLKNAVIGRSESAALHSLCHAYRHFAQTQPALYRMTLASTEHDDADLQAAGRASLEVLLAVLSGYGLEGERALHAIRCLRSALHGFVSLEIAGGFAMPLDLDDSFELLIRQQEQGLRELPPRG
ncbi:MAG: WHG domain-containing protein [Natronospirillum sp.]|uniref:TetR/AcrR family transcriptional regulator n=1 Tax=Natronospirillum sp. TaxID=2812955 RepID=UPI0025D065E6|nr:TetR/AcrR family transcriptional regulator [Natronospirillum sp.]MCH8552306.1 WHG domain-containing protein [Natronospirillum sp.]